MKTTSCFGPPDAHTSLIPVADTLVNRTGVPTRFNDAAMTTIRRPASLHRLPRDIVVLWSVTVALIWVVALPLIEPIIWEPIDAPIQLHPSLMANPAGARGVLQPSLPIPRTIRYRPAVDAASLRGPHASD